jgi:hypothetical protein
MSTKGNGRGVNGAAAIVHDPFAGQQSALAPQPTESLECVATAMDRVQQDIDQLWRDSVTRDNLNLSERLVEVSHALQRAARLLDEDRAIG